MTGQNACVKEIFIEKAVHFSDVEINALFDTLYVDKYTLSAEVHSHFNYEVHACLNGEYVIEGGEQKCITMRPGELCIIPAGYDHSCKSVDDKTERRAFRFYIKQNALKNEINGCYATLNALLAKNKNPISLYSQELAELIERIHKELCTVGNNHGAVSEILLIRFFSSLFAALIPKTQEILSGALNNDSRNSRAFKIESFLYNNYFLDISEQDLADCLNLSVRQSSRELKTLYGMSFREKLVSLRMTNAAKLLLRTNLSVSTIAEKVGYSSVPGFCTSFKKYYGLSPKRYKASIAEKHLTN